MLRFVVLLSFLLPALATAATWSTDSSVTATWNSNASNAERSSDRVDALTLGADLLTTTRVAVGADTAVFPGLHVLAEASPQYEDLSFVTAGGELGWRHKVGLGAFATTVVATARLEGIVAHDQNRNGHSLVAALGVRRRFNDTNTGELTQEFAQTNARASVYDRSGAQTSAVISHDFDGGTRASFGLFWRYGDIVSHATPPRPDLVALARTRMNVETFDRPFVVYSLRAATVGGHAELSRAIGKASHVALRYEYRRTSRDDLRYGNHLVSASVVHQF